MHLTMIFVDGLGLGTNLNNPLVLADTPHIDRILGGHSLWGDQEIQHNHCRLYSLDASLGVPGIPQSATGQTTLWTGVNAAKALGKHLNAYPNEKLKEIIKEYSIFKQLADLGKRVTFANAFTKGYEQMIEAGTKKHTASTLCAHAGGVKLKRREDLLEGKAVYQDITNKIFRERGEEASLIEPSQAGRNLARISMEHEFVLFEYFQTDVRGHKRNLQEAKAVVEILDQFLGGYLFEAELESPDKRQMAMMLTSDHGNIEDLSTSTHTLNKVPALCWSNFGMEWPVLKSIEEITPFIVNLLSQYSG
ncbi:MAG: metalloenzyme [Peptococcaceae bacterium]|nr:metalloenzyme [Peptococcaceae bacterium]